MRGFQCAESDGGARQPKMTAPRYQDSFGASRKSDRNSGSGCESCVKMIAGGESVKIGRPSPVPSFRPGHPNPTYPGPCESAPSAQVRGS